MARRKPGRQSAANAIWHSLGGDPEEVGAWHAKRAARMEQHRNEAAGSDAVLGDVGNPAAMQAALEQRTGGIRQPERTATPTAGELGIRSANIDTRQNPTDQPPGRHARATLDALMAVDQVTRAINNGEWQDPDMIASVGNTPLDHLSHQLLIHGGTGSPRPSELQAPSQMRPGDVSVSSEEESLLDQLKLDKYGEPVHPELPPDHPLSQVFEELKSSGDDPRGYSPLRIETGEDGRRYVVKPDKEDYFDDTDVYENAMDAYNQLQGRVPTSESRSPVGDVDPDSLHSRLGLARGSGVAPVTLRDVDAHTAASQGGPVTLRQGYSRGWWNRRVDPVEEEVEVRDAEGNLTTSTVQHPVSESVPLQVDMSDKSNQENFGMQRISPGAGLDVGLRILGRQFPHASTDHVSTFPVDTKTGAILPGVTMVSANNVNKLLGVPEHAWDREDEHHQRVVDLVHRHDQLTDETSAMLAGNPYHTPSSPVFGAGKVSDHPELKGYFDDRGKVKPESAAALSQDLQGHHLRLLASRITGMENYKDVVGKTPITSEDQVRGDTYSIDKSDPDVMQASRVGHFVGLGGNAEEFHSQVGRSLVHDDPQVGEGGRYQETANDNAGAQQEYWKTVAGAGDAAPQKVPMQRRAASTSLVWDAKNKKFLGGFVGTSRETRENRTNDNVTLEPQRNWIDHINEVIQRHGISGTPDEILDQAHKIKTQEEFDSKTFAQHKYHGMSFVRHSTGEVEHRVFNQPLSGGSVVNAKDRMERDPDIADFSIWRSDESGDEARRAFEGRHSGPGRPVDPIPDRIGSIAHGKALAARWSQFLHKEKKQRKNAVTYEPPREKGKKGILRIHERVDPKTIGPLRSLPEDINTVYQVVHTQTQENRAEARERRAAAKASPVTAAREKEVEDQRLAEENKPEPGSVGHAQHVAAQLNDGLDQLRQAGWGIPPEHAFSAVATEQGPPEIHMHPEFSKEAMKSLVKTRLATDASKIFPLVHQGSRYYTKPKPKPQP